MMSVVPSMETPRRTSIRTGAAGLRFRIAIDARLAAATSTSASPRNQNGVSATRPWERNHQIPAAANGTVAKTARSAHRRARCALSSVTLSANRS